MQPLRIEDPRMSNFITSRTINSKLWFVNNVELEDKILGILAKLQNRYQAILYGFILMGNHYHLVGDFPGMNRASFMRDFNSEVARRVGISVREFEGGKLFGRRYSGEHLPRKQDLEHWFFYVALNPVTSGICPKISQYRSYNSFSDSITGRTRTYAVVNWTDYNNRKRYNRNLTVADCTEHYELKFSRLPGYESLNQKEYREMMLSKLENRRVEEVMKRLADGKGFAHSDSIKTTKVGDSPFKTKRSTRNSKRPLFLTLCPQTRRERESDYFAIREKHREASIKFRNGDFTVIFPPGTYPPPIVTIIR